MNVDRNNIQVSNILKLRISERRILLILGDFIMASIALFISLYTWAVSERFIDFSVEFFQKRIPGWFFILPVLWVILMMELYDVNKAGDWISTIRGIFIAGFVGLLLYLILYVYYVDPPRSLLPRRSVAVFLVIVVVLTIFWRTLYIRVFHTQRFLRRVLLVGGGKSGRLILQVINNLISKPFLMLGVIDDDPQKAGKFIEGYQVIGTGDSLFQIVNQLQVTDIIVAITGEIYGDTFQSILDLQEMGVEITRMQVVYEDLLGRVPIQTLEANWILKSFLDEVRVSSFYIIGKRLMDIIGGLIGTLLMILVLPFVSLGIILDDGLPIFYRQIRSGKSGNHYRIIKFRTMKKDAEADGQPRWAVEDDLRNTRIGRFLRKTHLDELPQFINVLKGEMSLVGPRAERPALITMFQEQVPFYRARLLVKPGITGWAQINFGYASTVEETIVKLEFDLFYIKHRNLFMDFIVLLRTPAMVLGFKGR
jgi:exopolysaccharide biosynthesis polyprenyl glycosylphosphotransferase